MIQLKFFLDSTCSRASCSICSDSSNGKGEEEEEEEEEEEDEEEEETYSEESEDSRKEERVSLKQSKKRHYRKVSSQIPPLPVIKNTLSTSFNNIPSINKTDYTLIPSLLDTSNGILTSFNHSSHVSNPFLASTSFNKSYNIQSNFTSGNINSSPTFNNAPDDLMTTSFGSVSLTESEVMVDDQSGDNFDTRSYDKSLLNEIPYSFNGFVTNAMTTCTQDDSFISTPFNKPVYESEDLESNYLASSLNSAVDNNIMSTSFSTRITSAPVSLSNSFNTTNNNSETTSSMLQSAKSSKITDKLLTRILNDDASLPQAQLSLPGNICDNLMSTSFNYGDNAVPENNEITFPTRFNGNDQTIKLQQFATMEEKETSIDIPPPPSLTSSLANYLHGLPRKNYPLSKSAPGLSNITDESIQKFPSSKATCVPSRILQKPNSASFHISPSQKSPSFKTYRYNYDLDYVPFHGVCDDTNLQHSQTAGKKNFHPSYRLFENRYSSKSFQNLNVNKETRILSNIPPLPIINTSTANPTICSTYPSFTDAPVSSNEKPKVKFSDTVTHILVPGTVSIVSI